jgi:3-oxoacyl-[acyl-carrier protein] reductase
MSGKVIVITGANGGLGRALAQMFAEDGETVLLLGRSLEKVTEVARAIGPNATPVTCDVASPDSVRAAFAEIARLHPKIDVLINNAAVYEPFLVEEATDDQILDPVLINVAGPILCCRSAIPMLERGGQIINVSSESVENPVPHLLLYQSTKSALERFSKDLHAELEDRGIRVTIVRAGAMVGPGTSATMQPESAMRFLEAAAKKGINFMTRGVSQYSSTLHLFRTVVDLPPDVHIGLIAFHGRPTT